MLPLELLKCNRVAFLGSCAMTSGVKTASSSLVQRRMRLVRAKVSVDLNAGEGTEAASSWYEDMQRESTVLEPPLKRAKAAVNGD